MNFTVTLSEAWDVIRRPFQASPLPRAALLRLLPVVLSAILLGQPAATVDPSPTADRAAARTRWRRALERTEGWIPELSALDF